MTRRPHRLRGFEDLELGLGSARDVLSVHVDARRHDDASTPAPATTVVASRPTTARRPSTARPATTGSPSTRSGAGRRANAHRRPALDSTAAAAPTRRSSTCSATASRAIDVTDTAIDGATQHLIVNGTAAHDTFLLRRGLIALLNTRDRRRRRVHRQPSGSPTPRHQRRRGRQRRRRRRHVRLRRHLERRDRQRRGRQRHASRSASSSAAYAPTAARRAADPESARSSTRRHDHGRLTNGVSFPATINGGRGDDLFEVFRNKGVAAASTATHGDDTFIIRTFLSSTSSTQRQRRRGPRLRPVRRSTRRSTIDGGDGFDRVVVIGTEVDDTFVITADGVYGAGRYVAYINVEQLDVDGMEGDDRFYVLSTKRRRRRRGSSAASAATRSTSPATRPPSQADDLLGHSGLIEHVVLERAAGWTGIAGRRHRRRDRRRRRARVRRHAESAAARPSSTSAAQTSDTYTIVS